MTTQLGRATEAGHDIDTAAARTRDRSTRSLVLWSGGVDSSYSLLRVLRETGDEVFTHHVQLLSAGSGGDLPLRVALEGRAIDALREAITQRERHFRHTTSRVDPGLAGAGGGAALLAFMAARVALVSGFTPFDRILLGVNADRDPGWNPDTAACALRRARLAGAIRAAFGCDEVPHVYLWEPRPAKAHMLAYLGQELAALTVSCLTPAAGEAGVPTACGACARCREVPLAPGAGLSPMRGNARAARTPPLFRHLVESQSKRQESQAAAAASGQPDL